MFRGLKVNPGWSSNADTFLAASKLTSNVVKKNGSPGFESRPAPHPRTSRKKII